MAKEQKTRKSPNLLTTDKFVIYAPDLTKSNKYNVRYKELETGKIRRKTLYQVSETGKKIPLTKEDGIRKAQQARERFRDELLDQEANPEEQNKQVERITIADAFTQWFEEEYKTRRKRASTLRDVEKLAAATEKNRGMYIRAFENTFHIKYLDEISKEHIRTLFYTIWDTKEGKKPRTLIKHYNYMNEIFDYLCSCEYIVSNPMLGLCRKGKTKPKRWDDWKDAAAKRDISKKLSFEQCQRLLRACYKTVTKEMHRGDTTYTQRFYLGGEYLYTACLVALRAGLRRGNIVGMKWKNVDFTEKKFTFEAQDMKNGWPFETPIHSELLAYLEQLYDKRLKQFVSIKGASSKIKEEHVVPLQAGKSSEFKNGFKAAVKRAGLDEEVGNFRFHDLRHSFAVFVGNVSPYTALQQLMGHAPGTISEKYGNKLTVEERRVHLEKLEWFNAKPLEEAQTAAN